MRSSRIIRAVWACCLLIATANHARILIRHGLFWDYGGASLASAAYWSSLTVLDPLIAVLLFLRPRAGIVGTVVLIATNVAHNLAITAWRTPKAEFLNRVVTDPFLLSQIGFLLFVLATARIAWRGVDGAAARRWSRQPTS